MNFQQARAFHAVVQAGSFSRAARRLGLSQPAVTVQVKSLEAALGTPLFLRARGGAGIELTPAGRRLLAPVRQLLGLVEEIEHQVAETRELKRGVLKVGISTPFTILALMKRFAELYPGIDVKLSVGNTGELMRELEEGHVDVIVASQLAPPAHLCNRSLGRQSLALIAPRTHPLARRSALRLKEVSELPLLLREEGSVTRAVLLKGLERAGLAVSVAAELGSREMIKEAAAAGLGLGVVLEGEIGRDERLAVLRIADGGDLGAEAFLTCRPELADLGAVGALFTLSRELAPV
ncbi:LysR substrate-binding domain-containing protein [Afifella pfennigii]|uniref:LysR substrate-binding domain-containing protein n=1 Tax=Afifella pfennigii TaxID=209897 RepID=UPI00068DB8A3|nr:LysR substrate-binding domain-containing protein [Afifella pfennigii]